MLKMEIRDLINFKDPSNLYSILLCIVHFNMMCQTKFLGKQALKKRRHKEGSTVLFSVCPNFQPKVEISGRPRKLKKLAHTEKDERKRAKKWKSSAPRFAGERAPNHQPEIRVLTLKNQN